ncbi:MAG: galactonate oxidoreductase, partial [Magnetococcales bacterium]|nr:galactonate oxidoreductase [Magnetococcales bacterium]
MRAIVFEGGRLCLDPTRATPHPGAGEALIHLLAAGVCATDV